MSENANQYLYIGSYTDKYHTDGIYICELNASIGEMKHISTCRQCRNPNFLAVRKNRLYAVNEGDGQSWITAYQITAARKLQLLDHQEIAGLGPCHISVDEQLEYVYYANYLSGEIGRIGLNANGAFMKSQGDASEVIRHQGCSIHERQQQAHPHGVHIWEDRKLLLVPDLGLDQVIIYDISREHMQKAGCISVLPGDGPRHIAVHPNGRWLYLICELTNVIYMYEWEEKRGLMERQRIAMLPELPDKQYIAGEIAITHNGKFVIASIRAWGKEKEENGYICIFSIFSGGHLEAPTLYSSGGCHPRTFCLSTNDQFLLVGNQYSGNLVRFRFDCQSGKAERDGEVGTPEITCVMCE